MKYKTSQPQEKETKVPRWAVIALSVAWILLAIFAICVGIWQVTQLSESDKNGAPNGNAEKEKVVNAASAEYTYEEMEADLKELCRLYPNQIRMASAGQSLDGREIWYADVGDANAERQIFISAGIHGREYLTPLLAMEMVEKALRQNETGNCLFRVVPMVNPDGISISQKGMNGIRSEELKAKVQSIFETDYREYQSYRDSYATQEEYLKHWKANAGGVDLNRNFPIDEWNSVLTGISHPSSQKYKGSAAASEPETRAMMALIESLSNPVCVISLHSQGELLYWDCGQTGELRRTNGNLVQKIADLTGYSVFDRFTSPDATLDDWATLNQGIPSVNIETGKGKIPLPLESFDEIWACMSDLWKTLLAETA